MGWIINNWIILLLVILYQIVGLFVIFKGVKIYMTNYSHFNNEQREIIQHLLNQKKSFSYIANSIGKDRTSISKEIKRI